MSNEMTLLLPLVSHIDIQTQKQNVCIYRVIYLYSYSYFTQIQPYCCCKECYLYTNSYVKMNEIFKLKSRSQSFSSVFVYGEVQVKQIKILLYMS